MAYEQGDLYGEQTVFLVPFTLIAESQDLAVSASTGHSANTDDAQITHMSITAAAMGEAYRLKGLQDQENERIEALKVLEKEQIKLGDINPLIHRIDMGRVESVDAVRHAILTKIQETDGLFPERLEATTVFDPQSEKSASRIIARFEVENLTEDQICLLEKLVEITYGTSVHTRTDTKGNDRQPDSYPPTQPGDEMKSKTGGWYMGPDLSATTSLHQGLFVYRDLGPINKSNFLSTQESAGKYIVEIREASQYQTDLATMVTQVAAILSRNELLDRGQLLYETYYDIMRLGIKTAEENSIYGMEHVLDMIRRELILPLANPDISGGVRQEPQSVLMMGVPGTGKTHAVRVLLQEDTGVFILPIDPFELQKEIANPKDKQTLMPRIAEIARITGKGVVLHVDDVENMVGENEKTSSTLLNLMAGVQESGFYTMASANHPERINPSLLQPERFSVLIHCVLQPENARFEILKIHADKQSVRLGIPLFSSEAARDIILRELAKHTKGFTPRYLSNIVTVAKSHLISRIAAAKDKSTGLMEEDLADFTLSVDDWDKALSEVAAKYDSKEVIRRDEELALFVKHHSKLPTGFASDNSSYGRTISQAVYDQVAALENGIDVQS